MSEYLVFLADCSWLARVFGERRSKRVVDASVRGDYLHYEDDVVEVHASLETRAATVVGKAGGLLDRRNPVVMLDERGECYRWHGEAHRLFGHVRVIVATGAVNEGLDG